MKVSKFSDCAKNLFESVLLSIFWEKTGPTIFYCIWVIKILIFRCMARPFFENSFRWNDFPLVKSGNPKHRLWGKSKNQDFSTENEYFSLILSQVAVLLCTSSSESLSSNGQLWGGFRAAFGLDFAIFKTCARPWISSELRLHTLHKVVHEGSILKIILWDLFFLKI